MEVSMFNGFNDLGMNDFNFLNHQLQVNSIDEYDDMFELPIITTYDDNLEMVGTNSINNQVLSCKRSAQLEHHHTTLIENPSKQLKMDNNWGCFDMNNDHQHVLNSSQSNSNSSTMLSFSNNSSNSGVISPKEEVAIVSNATFPSHDLKMNQVEKKRSKFATMMPYQHSKDHIIAERKRREKLSQRFIALSTVIPGLKKMDKATVLEDAYKYVKQLQEQVKKLEEEAKKKTLESAIFVKKSYVSVEEDDDILADTKISGGSCDGSSSPFPEIEVRFSEKDVLIRITYEKKKGALEKLISKIEELHLVIISSCSLAFGGSTLAVTIVAQMNSEFSMTAKDLVRHLHTTLRKV